MSPRGPNPLRQTASLLVLLLAACERPGAPRASAPSAPSSPEPSAAPPASSLAPAPASPASAPPSPSAPPSASAAPAGCASIAAQREELTLAGHAPALVYLPDRERARSPVLLVAHGAGDNPDWQCAWWRHRVGGSAFVLCPRGVKAGKLPSGNQGYSYTSAPALGREIAAAVEALRARHGACVDDGPMVYAGFSQGAIFGVSLVSEQAARFPVAILVEGGTGGWTAATARRWREGGGQRALFGCGQGGCAAAARQSATVIERAGAQARVVEGKGAGHVYWGTSLEPAVYDALPWAIEGDARWQLPPSPPRTLDPAKNPPEPR